MVQHLVYEKRAEKSAELTAGILQNINMIRSNQSLIVEGRYTHRDLCQVRHLGCEDC
jgi:hypothetical protein